MDPKEYLKHRWVNIEAKILIGIFKSNQKPIKEIQQLSMDFASRDLSQKLGVYIPIYSEINI